MGTMAEPSGSALINESRSLDHEEILAFAISRSQTAFNITDLKALRLTNRQFRKLVEPWASRKLQIYPSTDADAISKSRLLDHVRELSIRAHYYHEGELFYQSNEREMKKHAAAVLRILRKTAPQLNKFSISCSDFLIDNPLGDEYKFPNLKHLEIDWANDGTVESMHSALWSMTSLETLSLPYRASEDEADGILSPADLEIIGEAPFLQNLTKMNLSFATEGYNNHYDTNAFDAPLHHVLSKAKSLKFLDVEGALSLNGFNNSTPEQLETLCFNRCRLVTGSQISLPRSLLKLTIGDCAFPESSSALAEFLTSGDLPQLKTLLIWGGNYYFPGYQDSVNWMDALAQMKFPMLERLVLSSCDGLTGNDAFSLAPTLANLKDYHVSTNTDVTDVHLIRQFCTSSFAPKLENLDLELCFDDDSFKEFLDNAANFKSLKHLHFAPGGKARINMLAEFGAHGGGWPVLEKLRLEFYNRQNAADDEDGWQDSSTRNDEIKKLLEPVWPGLELNLRSY